MKSPTSSFYARHAKRLIDCSLAASTLVAFSPVMAVVALAVRVTDGAPVLLRQQRTGLGGRSFELLKFRSMSNERDESGALLSDEKRLTPLGRLLRETSLDELPELLNVLRGEMSLVGPRPLLPQYMAHYSASQHKRHDVRPGITGWAAVNGRNTTSWEKRFKLDLWYLDHLSLTTDLRILLLTVQTILSRKNVNPTDVTTMAEFRGSSEKNSTT